MDREAILSQYDPALGKDCPTLEDLGRTLGLTKERVRQLLAKQGHNRRPERANVGRFPMFAPPPQTPAQQAYANCVLEGTHLVWIGGRIPTNNAPKMGQWYPGRVLWEHYIGPIPEGMSVVRLCDRKDCLNPRHAKLMTHSEASTFVRSRAWARQRQEGAPEGAPA